MDLALFVNVIISAFALSLSHCVFMCGGFAVILGRLLANLSRAKSLFYILLYHFGRICAYVCLGFVFGSFGAGILRNASAKGVIFFFCGVLLVIFGVIFQTRGRLLAMIENAKIQNYILNLALKLQKRKYIIILGFLNGLLPCGVVYYFLALSFSLGGTGAGFVMGLFGLCTLPALVFYAFFSRVLTARFRSVMGYIASVVICIYGLYLAYKGYMLI